MTEASPETEIAVEEPVDTLHPFFFELKKSFPILEIKENLRVTHRGLFVSEVFTEKISKTYQAWLEKQTHGEIHKSDEKAKKRLYGSLEPEGYYLIEGKNILSGFLVASEIKDPQKFGLPFYLGSLSSKKEYLHPNDPVLGGLKDVEIISEAGGAGVKVKAGDKFYTASPQALGYFVNVAKNSHRTMQEYPELEESLGVQCRAFVSLFRKSKPIAADKLLLVSEFYKESSKFDFRLIGSMVFVLDKKRSLVSVYGLRGKDLYRMIRREFATVKGRRLGSFEIYHDKHKLLGNFMYSARHYQLSTQAFIDFVLEASRSPDKKDKLPGILTVRRLFERFSEIFQTSQPIQRGLVKSYLSRFTRPVSECKINGVWLFIIGSDDVIEAAIPKF